MALHYSFEGSRALVTGGGRGIGRAIVQRLYEDKAHVFVIEKNPELCEKLKKELPNVTVACVDILDWKATKDAIAKFGVLDHVVNNAGVVVFEDFMDLKEETFELQMGVNLNGMIPVVQAAAKGMIESGKGGTVVNLSSMGGQIACPGVCAYSVSKAAVRMLTKAMALELGKHGIRVNSISPAGVATEMFAMVPTDGKTAEMILSRSVLPLPISTDQIADKVLFLLSPKADMITGTDLLVDCGITIT